METKAVILVCCLCMFNLSCAATLQIYRDSDGRIIKVEGKGAQETEVTKGDETIKFKTQQKMWPSELISFSGWKSSN